jgi:hypothetical protein
MSRSERSRHVARRRRLQLKSRRYLARKKTQVVRRLVLCLEELSTQEFTLLGPEERARVAAILDRLPAEIPDALVVRLRQRFAATLAA